MRSRRSSRDSRPSNNVEDGDDSDPPPLEEDADECSGRSPTLHGSLNPGDSSSRKGLPSSLLPSESKGWDVDTKAVDIPVPLPTKAAEEWTEKEKMEDTRRHRRSRPRSSWACSLATLVVALTSAFVLWTIMVSFRDRQCDAKGCRMSRMSPIYLKAKDFDTEHTRFASKYDLYLYREHGVDEDYPPRGVPVLFIPGNAGSYRQVRPIAAEAARQFKSMASKDEKLAKEGLRNLDFFTVDFNEDITAFHGQTLLDQAEYLNEAVAYILSLYHNSRKSTMDSDMPDPSSVIIFGHSMGGIVARTMLIMPNYQANSINTIITMSAPHARPPVSFDRQIVKTYDEINEYWRKSFSEKWMNWNPLWHVTLVSIAGGGLDNVVPSDYASISSLTPDTHGFTVFTSSIPDVWLGVDHLAILWCDQLMQVTAKAMLDIVDVRRAGQTKPRAERMRILKKWLLTGMEVGTEKMLPHKEPTTLLTLEDHSHTIISDGQRLILRQLGKTEKPRAYLMPIPPSHGTGNVKFSLMTDQRLDASRNSNIEVLFCSVFSLQAGQSATVFSMNMDLSGDSTGSTRLACRNAADDVIKLPASTKHSKHPFDLTQPFSYLEYNLEDIAEHQFVAVVDKASRKMPGWVIAEFVNSKESQLKSNINLAGLLMDGVHVTLPTERPIVTDINIPIIHSSLFAYKLTVEARQCRDEDVLFTPLVRQYLADPYESKFFVNVHEADINLHGTAPFIPPAMRPNARKGLSLQIWSDPTCRTPLEITVRMDFLGSLGRLVMRYRTVFAAFPLLIVALVLRKQFQVYDKYGRFISFAEGMDLFISQSLGYLLLSLSLLALSLSFSKHEQSHTVLSPLNERSLGNHEHRASSDSSVSMEFAKNDLLVGLQDPFFWFLAPLFALCSVGICVAMNYAAMIVIYMITAMYSICSRWGQLIGRDRARSAANPLSASSPRRRVLTTLTLLFFVATLIPYQFAYMVACIVQGASCVRALRYAREHVSFSHLTSYVGGYSSLCLVNITFLQGYGEKFSSSWDFYNYAHSILIIMLWILPINLPVLVVWHHNLAVHWLTPFSSHHNLLSIMPFILLVEMLTTGMMVPRMNNRVRHITSLLLLGLAAYSALYGVTYAYRLHHLVNILAAWFTGIHFSEIRPTLQGVVDIFTEDSGDEGAKKRHQ
ncbi:PGAP1-domain-containing protein [Ascodesmis nigricans]|uniref:GPI inositol-deacylase n=1 Tax=Ascodesmis nigricans TaxID=341454 RepID=A0A4S2N8E6_9PEZI|nr:PGAP1-domain-containing protein [Ascodesmis nigricans]